LALVRYGMAALMARAAAKSAEMLRRRRRTGPPRDVEVFQCIRKGGAHGERGMRHIGSRLADTDMDVNKLQMTRSWPGRSERRFKKRQTRTFP
jgi:hypothetical protein